MKTGYVGIVGLPNAGKSTLMNDLIDSKISIVTHKPQTTRRRIQGIQTVYDQKNILGQIVFVDAPGFVKAEKGLNQFLEKEAEDIMKNSDLLLVTLNVDCENKDDLLRVVKLVLTKKTPKVFVISKAENPKYFKRIKVLLDLIAEDAQAVYLLGDLQDTDGFFIDAMAALKNPKAVSELNDDIIEFLMSTEKDRKGPYYSKDAKQKFLRRLLTWLPDSEKLLFSEDDLTTEMTRDICAEIVREKCFEILHQEIPYQLAVETHKFDEKNPKHLTLEFTIIVGKDSHKKIVIGKGGETIKQIGVAARKDIEEFVERKVFMQTNVIVKENWFENNLMLKDLKYVIS
jgi:GTP-binding protein Era